MKRVFRDDSGFTIAELVVASSILFIALMAIMGAVVFSAESVQMQKQKEEATNIANGKVEVARNLPYDSVGIVGGSPLGSIPAMEVAGNYTITTAIDWQQDPASGKRMDKRVSIDVSWSRPRAGHFALSTAIFGKSLLSNVGDVEVRARYLKDSQPASAVPFSVAGMGDTTDVKGIAFFGAVPLGTYDIGLTPPSGYVYDVADVKAKNVTADSLTTLIVTFQKASSVNYTFKDSTTGAVLDGVALTMLNGAGATFGTGVTSALGTASFGNLSLGSYTLNGAKAGYTASSQSLTIATEASTSDVEVLMTPLPKVGSITVSVQDSSNANLQDATVTLTGTKGQPAIIQSTNAGLTMFSGQVPDIYTVNVTYPGYVTPVAQSTNLVAGGTSTFYFHLTPNSTKGKMSITTQRKGSTHGNMDITITGPNGYRNNNLTSNWSGNVVTDWLPEGTYYVKTQDNPTSTVTVLVTGGQTSQVTVNSDGGWGG